MPKSTSAIPGYAARKPLGSLPPAPGPVKDAEVYLGHSAACGQSGESPSALLV